MYFILGVNKLKLNLIIDKQQGYIDSSNILYIEKKHILLIYLTIFFFKFFF